MITKDDAGGGYTKALPKTTTPVKQPQPAKEEKKPQPGQALLNTLGAAAKGYVETSIAGANVPYQMATQLFNPNNASIYAAMTTPQVSNAWNLYLNTAANNYRNVAGNSLAFLDQYAKAAGNMYQTAWAQMNLNTPENPYAPRSQANNLIGAKPGTHLGENYDPYAPSNPNGSLPYRPNYLTQTQPAAKPASVLNPPAKPKNYQQPLGYTSLPDNVVGQYVQSSGNLYRRDSPTVAPLNGNDLSRAYSPDRFSISPPNINAASRAYSPVVAPLPPTIISPPRKPKTVTTTTTAARRYYGYGGGGWGYGSGGGYSNTPDWYNVFINWRI
jgi:hypothetical protein